MSFHVKWWEGMSKNDVDGGEIHLSGGEGVHICNAIET